MRSNSNIIIPASDSFDIVFASYFYGSESKEWRRILNDSRLRLMNNDLTYRIINHWEKNNLLTVERGKGGGGWRKYSLMDSIWVHLIAELRRFGVSIENIKKIKDQLEKKGSKVSPSKYPFLEFYTTQFLLSEKLTHILVFPDFQVTILNDDELDLSKSLDWVGSHITIPLHRLIQKAWNKPHLKPNTDDFFKTYLDELSESEKSLITSIRSGMFREIKIRLHNGQMILLEKEVENDIHEVYMILKEQSYDRITIEREDGNIVNIKRTVKEKL